MDPLELLSDLKNRGMKVYRKDRKVVVDPGSLLSPEDEDAIRQNKETLLALLPPLATPAAPVAVEVIYVEPGPRVTPVSPEFPPCRKCGARRFWIADSGKVVCGGRGCGEVNYILAHIEFHPIA